jgi:hypothetical protein
MVKRTLFWLPIPIVLLLMVACNLGQGVPTGDDPTLTPDVLIPAELPTNTPGGPPPTVTPSSVDPAVAQSIGPVAVTGDFTVGSTVSIRLKRGEAVSGVNCMSVHQETSGTTVLSTPTTSGPSLDGTYDETFTFVPEQGGTYNISCTGNALTLDQGLLEVEASSSSFSIEAKG